WGRVLGGSDSSATREAEPPEGYVPRRSLGPSGFGFGASAFALRLWCLCAPALLVICLAAGPAASQPEGDDALEKSINKALKYLDQTQEPDGCWRMGSEKSTAITGLAVMAFLSAGHVPGEGPYAGRI